MPILVFGNKVDRRDAVSEEEFRELLDLPYHETYGKGKDISNVNRKIEVFMISAAK